MTKIAEREIGCSCGHKCDIQLYRSINSELDLDAVDALLQGKINRPACPACGKSLPLLTPVLFNDMERNLMVLVGSTLMPDGSVNNGTDSFPAIIHAANYFIALSALAIFRRDPANAVIPREQMDAGKSRAYVQSFLRVYQELSKAAQEDITRRKM